MIHNLHNTVKLPHLSMVMLPVSNYARAAKKSCMNTREELIAYIKRRMKELGYNQSSLSLEAGCDKDTLRNLFEGKSQNLRADNYTKIMSRIKETKVNIIGYAGAGERVYYFDDGHAFEQTDRPPEAPEKDIVALIIRGDSMRPVLEEGFIVFYSRSSDGVPDDCIGRMCVVRLDDDSTMVKKIKHGSAPGLYHLISHNADALVDQPLKWAARVLYTKYN